MIQDFFPPWTMSCPLPSTQDYCRSVIQRGITESSRKSLNFENGPLFFVINVGMIFRQKLFMFCWKKQHNLIEKWLEVPRTRDQQPQGSPSAGERILLLLNRVMSWRLVLRVRGGWPTQFVIYSNILCATKAIKMSLFYCPSVMVREGKEEWKFITISVDMLSFVSQRRNAAKKVAAPEMVYSFGCCCGERNYEFTRKLTIFSMITQFLFFLYMCQDMRSWQKISLKQIDDKSSSLTFFVLLTKYYTYIGNRKKMVSRKKCGLC